MDFNFVTDRLATGAAPHSNEDIAILIKAGITHIVDVTSENDDSSFLTNEKIIYLFNPTQDDGQTKPVSWFQTSIEFALRALSFPNNKVFAHCSAGVNRGPSTAYAILRAQGLKSSDAEGIIRAARPQVGLAYKNNADNAIIILGYC